MNEEGVVHTDNGTYSAKDRGNVMPFAATWLQLEIIILE